MLSLDMPEARHPYQSFVPLVGNSIAEIFEHYLEQSEQQPSRLFVTAGPQAAACLFLQKMPDADARDADGWQRITQLAATVKPGELLELAAEALLERLFHEEMTAHGIRVYDPAPVVYHCPQDWTKVRDMIRSLGRADAETILHEHGEIVIRDDICNHEYRFSADDIAELFASDAAQTRH
jgi:molecular chaperone Hsp33